MVGVDSRTGQRWIACYRKGGLDALRRRKRAGKGKASYLTPEQKQRLKAWANAGNLESVPDAVAFVAQEFGVTYSASGLYKLLVMLRLRKKMPRPQNAKASAQVQEAFKKGLRDWLLSVQSSSVTFCDEMRLGLHSQLRRRWCEIGVKLVQPQQMRFEWAWLSVCVDVTACRLTWCWQPNLKVASMLETLERFYQAGIRSLIWDNAPAHRAKVVRDTALAVGFLPPFSPELNPSERLFGGAPPCGGAVV